MIYTQKVHDVIKGEETPKGTVVMVDRLWPRGVAKADLAYDQWFKHVAPSPELRKWWGHRKAEFAEFSRRYTAELDASDDQELTRLAELAKGDVTLLYAAADREVNHAVVLRDWLRG